MRTSPSTVRTTPTQEGGSGGGGVGANGTWSYDSGGAGLTFGTVAPGDTKEISFTGNDDGGVYVTRAVFSGLGKAGYEISRVTRNGVTDVLDTPFDCDSGEDFVIGVDEPSTPGATWAIQFRVVYTTGAEETMTVELYDGAGTLVDTITATATVQDPFLAQAIATGNLEAFYSPADLTLGAVADDAPAMTDLLGNGPDLLFRRIVGGAEQWTVVDDNAPGSFGVLAKSLKINRWGRDYGYAVGAAPAAVGVAGLQKTWVIIMRKPTPSPFYGNAFLHLYGDETNGLPVLGPAVDPDRADAYSVMVLPGGWTLSTDNDSDNFGTPSDIWANVEVQAFNAGGDAFRIRGTSIGGALNDLGASVSISSTGSYDHTKMSTVLGWSTNYSDPANHDVSEDVYISAVLLFSKALSDVERANLYAAIP